MNESKPQRRLLLKKYYIMMLEENNQEIGAQASEAQVSTEPIQPKEGTNLPSDNNNAKQKKPTSNLKGRWKRTSQTSKKENTEDAKVLGPKEIKVTDLQKMCANEKNASVQDVNEKCSCSCSTHESRNCNCQNECSCNKDKKCCCTFLCKIKHFFAKLFGIKCKCEKEQKRFNRRDRKNGKGDFRNKRKHGQYRGSRRPANRSRRTPQA